MSKFKVGDKVRVREDLVVGESYKGLYFVEGMKLYRGKLATIERVYSDGDYQLQGCDTWFFTDEMLEPVKENIKVTYDEVLDVFFVTNSEKTLCFREFGMSSTHPNDQYDEEMGKALAYFRFMGGNINE